MKTLVFVKELLSFYKDTGDAVSFVNTFNKMINQYPHLLYPLYGTDISREKAISVFQNIKDNVKKCFIPIFPTYSCFTDFLCGSIIETPIFDNPYYGFDTRINKSYLDDYLVSCLISLQIKKVKITFIELDGTCYGDYFYKNINSELYNTITTEYELKDYIDKLKKRIILMKQQYGDYREYCLSNRLIPVPYEILVFPEPTDKESTYASLLSMERECNAVGVKLIRVVTKDWTPIEKDYRSQEELLLNLYENKIDSFSYEKLELNSWKCYHSEFRYCGFHNRMSKFNLHDELYDIRFSDSQSEDFEKYNKVVDIIKRRDEQFAGVKKTESKIQIRKIQIKRKIGKLLFKCTPIGENLRLRDACIEYINREADCKEEAIVLIQDLRKLAINTYEKDYETITVPIGQSANADVNFCMDNVSHVHSFIIGQSGSGKSVFLHNIIGSAILKYAPEDLQLYLLDFKLGGVEFNRYKGIKHVKSLLVDNSDQQITLEILRELREQMVERGKMLRNCGVNNLVEYNRQHPNAAMPQILLIVDECHEMFRVGSDVPRVVSNEISEIVIKIAKEGRSQGVHLILATQTLSGTEISNEILNNISDHYLLKCASVDSERMVERSSDITKQLSTGQIYYHHVDSQMQFQAYYNDKDAVEMLIKMAKEKAEKHRSNDGFYFNGSQLFKLDKGLLLQGKKHAKHPVAYMGKSISINQNDLSVILRNDYSENILLFGLNDLEQVTRTTVNLFISLMLMIKYKGLDYQFKVFNCLSDDESLFVEQLEMLEEEGYCEIIEGRKDRGKFLKNLVEGITNETVENTILLILGQERFRELKMDMKIDDMAEVNEPKVDDAFGFGGFSNGSSSSYTSAKTFRQALELILDKGPESGVHTVMQLDKPSNFLFSDYVSPKIVHQKFKHLIMLKSDEAASAQLHLNDEIRLETLSKEPERLRAYYYSEESDTYTLFTPYMGLGKEELINLFKTE